MADTRNRGTEETKPAVPADTPDVVPETEVGTEAPTMEYKLDTGEFTEDDADDTGWIVFKEPPDVNHVRKEHRIPVRHWKEYERLHNL